MSELDKFRALRAHVEQHGTPADVELFADVIAEVSDDYEALVHKLRKRGALKSLPQLPEPESPSTMKSNLLSARELKEYSLTRAIKNALDAVRQHRNPLPGGLEGEVSKTLASNLPSSAVNGFLVPFECLATAKKTLNVTTAAQGGFLGQSKIMEPLDVLRAESVVARAGALLFENVKSKLTFPRQATGATGQWLSEIGMIQPNDAPWEALALVPHRLGAMTKFTNELLMQTGGVVESWARREILGAVASAIDAGALSGTGGVQPLGIANSALVQTITFGGAATREKLLEMEANVANAHAPDSNVVFVASPTVRKKLKSAPASPSVDYLWTDAGTVVGRPAFASTNAPGSRIICGAFTHYSVAMFGMLDILVNPFNEDATGNVRVSINAFADCGELYPKSFCVSTDDANQ